ncbi:MAG TPA: GDP-mannose 4,6-dehydratase [Kiritimatiellia bacterium]|nr:GDP-mannose 4,6-dehydratase [Kiritimatiellia bacterium]
MRVLVTGAAGFVGKHAVHDLLNAGHDVIAMVEPGHEAGSPHPKATTACNLLDQIGMQEMVKKHRPDACLHLAGIAFVPMGWTHPQDVFNVNVTGTVNLLEAFRHHHASARVLIVSSSQIYGQQPRDHVITESDNPAPDNLYALSKWTADGIALLYARQYGMPIMTARPCNHIGPGQSENFVVSAFARQLVKISHGMQENRMRVGNLASQREFTDVRDTARAYRLLLEKGLGGRAYNVTSGRLFTIQELFDLLCDVTGVTPEVEVDPALYRPTDIQPVLDITRIFLETGWRPEIPIRQTLGDVVHDISVRLR